MAIDLHGGDATDASFYSGLLVSAYAVAEALTAVGWGTLSDSYGRKPVVLVGLGGVALSSLILGFATNYWVALLARFVGGALNGNVSVMQTMVAEMVKLPEHERESLLSSPLFIGADPRTAAAYATQPFVWTLGGIIGSAMGGFLAQPAHFYPDTFAADGVFGRYPYLLPNLASVVMIVISIIQGLLFLEETNPIARQDDCAVSEEEEDSETTPLRPDARVSTSAAKNTIDETVRPLFMEESVPALIPQTLDIRRTSFGTIRSVDDSKQSRPIINETDSPGSNGSIWNKSIIMLIVALTFFAYHQIAFGALLPVHLLDTPHQPQGHLDLQGGFGYTLHDVSKYLTVNGVISLFIQAFVFPPFVRKVGVWHSFVWMAILYPTAYLLMPFLSAAPALIPAGIYASMLLQAIFGIIINPTALILLKDATPSSQVLGRVNGLAMSACCVARTISPPLVGVVYSAGGSGAAWFSCAGVAVLGALQLFWIPRKRHASIL